MTMTADGTRPVAAPVAAIRQQQRREWTTLVEEIALLRSTDDQNALAMGDLFVEIEDIAGKQHLKVAAEQAGVEPIKAKQRHWVSRKIPPNHRIRAMMRESGLSFSHLRRLAGLERDEDMIRWAQRAIDSQWSVQRLKDEIAASEDAQAKQGGVECCCCHQELKPEDTIVTLRVDRAKQVRACSHQCAIHHLQDDAEERNIVLTGRCRPAEAPSNVVQIPSERLNRAVEHIREAGEADVQLSPAAQDPEPLPQNIYRPDMDEMPPDVLREAYARNDVPHPSIRLVQELERQDQSGEAPAPEPEDNTPPRSPNLSAQLDGLTDLADDPFAS